jgi:hypothetical protein
MLPLSRSIIYLFICLGSARKSLELHLPELQCVMVYLCFFLVPSRHRTRSPLHCNRRSTPVKPQYIFSFFYFRCKFYGCASRDTKYKLCPTAYSERFCFSFRAFQFMRNVMSIQLANSWVRLVYLISMANYEVGSYTFKYQWVVWLSLLF